MKQNKIKKIEGIARIWPHSVLFVLFFFFFCFFFPTFLYLSDFMNCEMLTGIFNLIVNFFFRVMAKFPKKLRNKCVVRLPYLIQTFRGQ